jgi:hypothetical protein
LHKLTITGIATLIGLVVLASTATAGSAKRDPGVLKRGKCSVHSAWKLKAKYDDGRIETAFEVGRLLAGI